MSTTKEIQALHNSGFVILRAARTTNAPIGWKRKISISNKKAWGYAEEMADPLLTVYHSTFNAEILSKSHCGFYLGHGNLCCIDLDTKKIDPETTSKLADKIKTAMGNKVAIETTKSNGFHVYFLFDKRLDNNPDWTGKGKENWIELYYSKRFIACYLSNSKRYTLTHGKISDLKTLSAKEHNKLLGLLKPFKGKESKRKKSKAKKIRPVDEETWTQAEEYTKQIEEKGIDITGDNPTWFKIGKGIANAFGQKGFDIFNRISQFSPLYNADTIADDYTRFVEEEARPRDKKITIATFFMLCEDAGLHDLKTLVNIKKHPIADHKEFELTISKKETMGEKVHTVVNEFLKHVEICCIDRMNFFIFENTHWIKRNESQVVALIKDFIRRSNVDDKYRKQLNTLPYMDMAIRELKLITQRDVLEPRTGNLHEGIFINMENGVLHVDMKSGKRKLLDHESKYNFTTILPYCYDPTVKCERFQSWMETQVPNKDLQIAYYAFVASCLTKHKADTIMLLVGETSTGKSSLIETTRRVIGIENSAAVSAGVLFSYTDSAQAQVMQMENKLLAYDYDSQPFKNPELLLKIAAQEPLPGWEMRVARRPVYNYGRLLIAMNPYNYSVFSPAIARRLITVNMDVPVIKDNSVMPAIFENELAGIFNLVLNIGIKHLLESNGQIKRTDEMRQITLRVHTQQRDAVRWFDSQYFVLKQSDNKNIKLSMLRKLQDANPQANIALVAISDMYQRFRTWMELIEGNPESRIPLRKHFASDLEALGIKETQYRIDEKRVFGCYVGIKKEEN